MITYFSLISGELYELPDDFTKPSDKYQLKLNDKPKSNCKKCYDRFYTSFNPKLKIYNICPSCTKKLLATDVSELTIETPRTLDQIEFVD